MENMTIDHILHNNRYNSATHSNFRPHKSKPKPPDTHKKWALFTYIGPETRFITKIFRHTSVNIAFCTKNTIQQHLSTHPQKYMTVLAFTNSHAQTGPRNTLDK
jgi:hypothetical protein